MPPTTRHLSVVRSGTPPARGFIRPMLRDVKELVEQLASDLRVADGLVFDPRVVEQPRWRDLATACEEHQISLVLDTLGVELRAPGTRDASSTKAPWAGAIVDEDPQLAAAAIADFCSNHPEFSAVLAPSFILAGSPAAAIRSIDPTVADIREALDSAGRDDVQIHYPLVGALPDLEPMTPRILDALRNFPVDALWLRVHRVGREAGQDVIRRYIRWCRLLHDLEIPLIGDQTGQLGVGLYAFGAVSALSSGLTFGDRPDIRKMSRPPQPGASPNGFAPPPRVCIPGLDLYLLRAAAQGFFATRPHKASYGCQRSCCPRGVSDMISEPRRHFLARRQEQIDLLAQVPQHLLADAWMDDWLRPASDSSFSLASRDQSFSKHAKRLRGWREAFVAQHKEDHGSSSVSRSIPMVVARSGQESSEDVFRSS